MLRTALLVGFCCASISALADTPRGQFRYATEQQCASAHALNADQCRAASLNATAEFDEKVPHFPSRDACEKSAGRNHCMIGEFAGGGSAYFVPQRAGFLVTIKSDRDMTVVPVPGARSQMGFRPRSILKVDRARNLSRGGGGGRGAIGTVSYGEAVPNGEGGPLPPPPKFQPGFDCNALLEPAGKGDDLGCYPVSPGMLQHLKRE